MGIYSNGVIFGIRICVQNDEEINILFEKKYNAPMNDEQKREAYMFYNSMDDKKGLYFKIYNECCASHDINNTETFMMWNEITLNVFLEKFGI
jgi:hypothetical protein